MTAAHLTSDDWTADAACRDEPPQRFTDPRSPEDVRAALDTCVGCAVRAQCLTTALTHTTENDIGIWGSTTVATRDRIRNGELTIEEALGHARGDEPQPHQLARHADRATRVAVKALGPNGFEARPVPQLPAPELTLGRDANGDYTDATGRVIVFRIHGDPPYMLMIDDHCIARTRTVTEARRLAWTTLHEHEVVVDAPPSARSSAHDLVRR